MAGVFVDTFGVPATVVTGGLVFSIATLLSTFATELYQLYITRGVIGACGSGILFASPIHGLAITFGEKISFAAGFTYMGAGVGAIVFGYAGKAIVAVGDWQWYYRMVSFVALLAIPSAFALFIKPAISIEDVDGKGTEMTDSRGCSRAMDKLRNGFICLYESLKRGKALYRDINFLLIGACYFFFALGYFFPFIASVSVLLNIQVIRLRSACYLRSLIFMCFQLGRQSTIIELWKSMLKGVGSTYNY